MEGINRVVLMGNLGADPEVRVLESGVKLARFSLATSERYIDQMGVQCVHTEWHNIVCWRTIASYCEYHFKRGSLVRIEGKIRSRQVIDNSSLQSSTIYEIIADHAQLMVNELTQRGNSSIEPHLSTDSQQIDPAPMDPDSLPF